MQRIVDASWLTPGMVIYHQPRNHFYIILNKTMIKKDDGGWEYGWTYVQAEKNEEGEGYVYATGAESYSRPFSLFDSDWHLAY